MNFHEIWAAQSWPTNADMIEDVVQLGYIRPTDTMIDMTWGRGKWWTKYTHPGPFVAMCNEKGHQAAPADNVTVLTHVDFRVTGLPAGSFDVVVFDPPYVSKGGRDTSTIPDFNSRYGLDATPRSPRELHDCNTHGLGEAKHLCKPGGLILVKCMDYVSSGKLQPASLWMYEEAVEMKLQLHDRLIHVGSPGPQPKVNLDGTPRRQVHSRSNHSTLWVFKKPGRRRR
jgi:hypothetical protein